MLAKLIAFVSTEEYRCEESLSSDDRVVKSTEASQEEEDVGEGHPFMEMEYHGTWWTGIEHEDFRTKTYDICQHPFMNDLDLETEVFVDALTEDGFEFSFQYTKKTDPVYALEPTKRYPEGRRWTGITWVMLKPRAFLLKCSRLTTARVTHCNWVVLCWGK
eukprot:5071321-Amphidinium_carterae.1